MITLDRLVLDVPGMTPERARRLSHEIAAMLAEHAGSAAPIDGMQVLLPPGAGSDAAILAALSAALRARVI